MRYLGLVVSVLLLVGVAGCNSASSRIQEHAAEFAALDSATQTKIKQGVVETGYTSDMVYMALGRPAEASNDAAGNLVWTYIKVPVTANNETIQDGFRRRVVYDPVKRTDDVIVEPIDTKAFPNLVPHSIRITFRDGKVVSFERINRI
jgi:hypothetical protein